MRYAIHTPHKATQSVGLTVYSANLITALFSESPGEAIAAHRRRKTVGQMFVRGRIGQMLLQIYDGVC